MAALITVTTTVSSATTMIIDLSRVVHFIRPLGFVWRAGNRILTIAAAVVALLIFFNEPLANQTRGYIQAISPIWAAVPIALLFIWPLYRRVLELEDRVAPMLDIRFEPTPYYLREVTEIDPRSPEGVDQPIFLHFQLVAIGVRNISAHWINSISIRLDDLYDDRGRRGVGQVPTGLLRPDGKGTFPLRPGEEKIAHVARRSEEYASSFIQVLLFDGTKVPLDYRTTYYLKIGAYAPNIQPCMRKFKLWVDRDNSNNGELKFEAVGPEEVS